MGGDAPTDDEIRLVSRIRAFHGSPGSLSGGTRLTLPEAKLVPG